jgi:alkaline phosphatase D
MRFKWARLFSLPSNRNFYANHTTYWIKDDHDTLKNDCWAGQHFGAVSFEEGIRIFNQEQFPSFQPRYRTIQWGKDLQFWVLEGRDFRSPNTMPDGPTKTILGNEQKEWLKRTLAESTATFKLVFSPTPIVGPDRPSKSDNHANKVFEFEGNELRQLFGATDDLLVFCGDRHWQYASLDTDLNLWEFGCGPGSQNHELGWKQNDIRLEHRFLRVQGGFLSGTLNYDDNGNPKLVIGHHDVQGRQLSNFPFLPHDNNSHDDSE